MLEKSQFEPIVVTRNEEAVRPHSSFPYTDEDTFDQKHEHVECGGIVKMRRVSKISKALFCPDCGLRRYFPIGVSTYGELRKHFVEVLRPRERKNKKQPTNRPVRAPRAAGVRMKLSHKTRKSKTTRRKVV